MCSRWPVCRWRSAVRTGFRRGPSPRTSFATSACGTSASTTTCSSRTTARKSTTAAGGCLTRSPSTTNCANGLFRVSSGLLSYFKLVKHYCRCGIRKYSFTQKVINCHYMLLTPSQLIVSRLRWMTHDLSSPLKFLVPVFSVYSANQRNKKRNKN